MPRGNPDNLRAAAQRKRHAATQRAETALRTMIDGGEPITFHGLAKAAGVSIDFLYRSPLRARVEQLRAKQQRTPPGRAEIARLEAARAAAQGENLELRRRLGRMALAPADPADAEHDAGKLTETAPPARRAAE